MTNRLFALSVLCALVATPQLAQADDLVAQSCSVLKQSADARADLQSDEIQQHLLDWTLGRRFKNWSIFHVFGMSPRKLPGVAAKFRSTIPARDFQLARTIAGLTAQSASPALVAATTNELNDSMRHLSEKFSWKEGEEDHVTGMRWDAQNRQETICGTHTDLPELGRVDLCAVIDLASGDTTYEVNTSSPAAPLLLLGRQTPRQASEDCDTLARIRMQLRQRQYRSLPAECRPNVPQVVKHFIDTEVRGFKLIGNALEDSVRRGVHALQNLKPAS